jgi:formylglycine-generating enzyme required for sulfatase activity
MMGSPASEVGRVDNETQHEVTLTKPFYMGKYEVTQEQWEAVMGNNPSETKGVRLPVNKVSWNDCQDFIKKLNAKTSGGYRLPTEAEWEYACRAGTTTAYSFGDVITPKHANYTGSKIGIPVTIGNYQANAFGLFDMHGNVLERCENWYGYYPAGIVTDPKGPEMGTYRMLRGGSNDGVSSVRSSDRCYIRPSARLSSVVGFRLAKTAELKAEDSLKVTKPDPVAGMPVVGNFLIAPFTEAKAKEVQKAVAKSLQKEVEEKADLGKGVKLDMVLIPAGKFMMGSPASEVGRKDNETQHEVTLTKPFYMGKYEVTQEQWQAVMGNNPSVKTKGARLPLTDISWNDCQEFIKKLNAKTKGGYRLPTEAEWEYACRAGTVTAYSYGDGITKSDVNYRKGAVSITAVGSYRANAFGLYDMHGNVDEWCEDWYGVFPAGSVMDPKGPGTGDQKVLRGGCLSGGASEVRSSSRDFALPITRVPSFGTGFRLARTP